MSISYIVEKIKPDYIGYVAGDSLPPLVSIHGGRPMPPIRIYHSKKQNSVYILAEFALPPDVTYEMSEKIIAFIKSSGISEIISVGGMPIKEGDEKYLNSVFSITSTKALSDRAQKAGIKPVTEGISTGVSALIMLRSEQEGIDNLNLLIPVRDGITDPKYAELAIEAIKGFIKLEIDTSELAKEAKILESKINEIMSKNKQAHQAYASDSEQAGPSMYA
jgi:Archaeal enzymes of ATP-grasp superfamily